MNRIIKWIALCVLVGILGCKTTIAPDADPVVVRAQQSLEISLAAVDKFVKWEYKNREVVSTDVHETAQLLRKNFPVVFRSALDLLDKYKAHRNPITKQKLDNAMFQVKNYVTQAQTVQ